MVQASGGDKKGTKKIVQMERKNVNYSPYLVEER